MLNIEQTQNGGAVVCDSDITNIVDKHFVKANGTQRSLHNIRNGDSGRSLEKKKKGRGEKKKVKIERLEIWFQMRL
jgi:hypothetical protein